MQVGLAWKKGVEDSASNWSNVLQMLDGQVVNCRPSLSMMGNCKRISICLLSTRFQWFASHEKNSELEKMRHDIGLFAMVFGKHHEQFQ